MATQLNTITLSDFVRLGDFVWDKALMSAPSKARNSGMFRVSDFPANTGNTIELNEVDLEEYSSLKNEGDQADQALLQEGYSKILTLRRFGKDIPITWEMRRRNKYEDVVRRLTNVAKMQMNKMDLDLSHRLTFATAISYTDKDGATVATTTGDGYALAYTAHTVRGSSSTYRNRVANNPQLSKGGLETMEQMAVENTINQFAEKMTVNMDILWTTDDPNTINTARELLQSTSEISSTNDGVPNVYRGKYKHVVLPRVATTATGAVDTTKRRYWGLASSEYTSANLKVEQEPTLVAPASGSNAEDFSTEDWSFKGRTSYGIAILNGQWFAFSDGLGTA